MFVLPFHRARERQHAMKSSRNVNGKYAASSRSGAPHTPASLGRTSPDISHGGKDGGCRTSPKAATGRDMGKTSDAANAQGKARA